MDDKYRIPEEDMIARKHSGEALERQQAVLQSQVGSLARLMAVDGDFTLAEMLNGQLLCLHWFLAHVRHAYPEADWQETKALCQRQFPKILDALDDQGAPE